MLEDAFYLYSRILHLVIDFLGRQKLTFLCLFMLYFATYCSQITFKRMDASFLVLGCVKFAGLGAK